MNKYLVLGKITIAIPVALTGFLGYYMAAGILSWEALLATMGIFFLAMASGALNQVQEAGTDALMERTAGRPLPSGSIRREQALVAVASLALAGTALLAMTGSWPAPALGLFTLAWYNGVYTPLKKRTAFAVLPGALIGALPPLIGWSAAGRNPADLEILVVAFLLFVGQMPHYWLLLLKRGKEFTAAGLPVITSLMNTRQIRNLTFTWTGATAAAVLMLPATPLIHHRGSSWVLVGMTLVFLFLMYRFSFRGEILKHWKRAFITVNLFYLVLILVLVADRVF